MKIQIDFCEIKRFQQVNAGLSCRAKCNHCKKPWNDTGTKAVSRGVALEKVNGRPVEKVFYFCSDCAAQIQGMASPNITSECN